MSQADIHNFNILVLVSVIAQYCLDVMLANERNMITSECQNMKYMCYSKHFGLQMIAPSPCDPKYNCS